MIQRSALGSSEPRLILLGAADRFRSGYLHRDRMALSRLSYDSNVYPRARRRACSSRLHTLQRRPPPARGAMFSGVNA